MTREHKLALIVGFSLVLVLGVLLSDHFSKARQSTLEGGIQTMTTAEAGVQPPGLMNISEPGNNGLVNGQFIDQNGRLASAKTISPVEPLPELNGARRVTADQSLNGGQQQVAMGGRNGGIAGQLPGLVGIQENHLNSAGGAQLKGAVPPVGMDTGSNTLPPKTTVLPPAGGATSIPMNRHEVTEGDSIFAITRQYYGDGKLWEKVREYNKERIGPKGELREGVTLLLPPKDVLLGKPYTPPATVAQGSTALPEQTKSVQGQQGKPVAGGTGSTPGGTVSPPAPQIAMKEYTVQSGDTLASIARKQLGSAKRVQDLIQANKNTLSDPDTLSPGMKLKIPVR